MRFAWVSPFHDGLAAVAVKKTFDHSAGFIQKEGAFSIPPAFDFARSFCGGLAAVAIGNQFGYIDKAGKTVAPLKYEEASTFSGELAQIILRDSKGLLHDAYIKKDGSVAWVSEDALPSVKY